MVLTTPGKRSTNMLGWVSKEDLSGHLPEDLVFLIAMQTKNIDELKIGLDSLKSIFATKSGLPIEILDDMMIKKELDYDILAKKIKESQFRFCRKCNKSYKGKDHICENIT